MSKMDDARRASRDRELTAKNETETSMPWLRENAGQYPRCPRCGDSVAFLVWNPRTELWEHVRCGFTATQQEIDEGLV